MEKKTKLMEIFESTELVKCAGPMVRFSKLPFRELVRRYSTDIVYTPMIMSDSFVQSPKARDSEFTTCSNDRPLVVQFAANNAKDFADAAELVFPYADGVDLNCGCPQTWAMSDGYGAKLLTKPELIKDIVHQTTLRTTLPVSIKIRINSDLRKTIDIVKMVESVGVSFVTVHGRTTSQRSSTPPNYEAIKIIKEEATVPILANGSVFSLKDAKEIQEKTGVNGVMAARGILENPSLFAGYEITPLQCVQDFVDISMALGNPFYQFQHHLAYMLEKILIAQDKKYFSSLTSSAAVLDFLEDKLGIAYDPNSSYNQQHSNIPELTN